MTDIEKYVKGRIDELRQKIADIDSNGEDFETDSRELRVRVGELLAVWDKFRMAESDAFMKYANKVMQGSK